MDNFKKSVDFYNSFGINAKKNQNNDAPNSTSHHAHGTHKKPLA